MEPQLTEQEITTIRALRHDEELPYSALGERLGVDPSAVHRILTKPGYRCDDLTLIRVRKGLARLNERKSRRQRATA